MSGINPLRRLYNYLSERLSGDDERQLRNLVHNKQIVIRQLDKLKSPADMFIKLEESGHISETNLGFLKDLLKEIDRLPLVSEVERVEKEELRVRRLERVDVSDESNVQTTDLRFSVGGDITASSEMSSKAVRKEMDRTMQDTKGELTSLQHHIDKHSLQPSLQPQAQEQAGDNTDSSRSGRSEESPCPDVLVSWEQYLKSLYMKLSKILPFPWWDGTNRLKLENVYTELELETAKGEKRDFDRREIFSSKQDEESRKTPKRVLIEGDPGYGKSTFCKQLIYDWAKGNTEYLNCFKLVFHFEMRELLYSNAQTIQDAIFDKLLRNVMEKSEKPRLWEFVQNNQTKVCFVFDGLDEVPTKALPPFFQGMIAGNCILPNCPVIVTSRKIRDKNSKQMYDTQLLIKRFDYEKARLFIEKHIDEMKSQGKEAKALDFLQELGKSDHKSVLIEFMQSPLNTLMLCDIWMHSNKLPNTRTKLYEEIINYVVQRYTEKHDNNTHCEEEIKQALFLMGEISYKGLTAHERKLAFSEEDISNNRYIRELGLLTKVSEFPSRYSFFHLTFQEYFASIYMAHLLTNDRCKFIDAITPLSKGIRFGYNIALFAFLGGKLQTNVDEIFKAMQQKGIFQGSYSSFDWREALYESCCTSTAVIENCAEFLPEYLTVNLNTMVSHSDSNRLKVNTAILQCPRTRSTRVTFELSAGNANTVTMYRKCYEALTKNRKKFNSIGVCLTVDLNDFKGRGYVDNLTFINNTDRHSSHKLKPLNINDITVEISKRVKSPNAFIDHYLTTMLQSLSLVSANSLLINDLPLGNLELARVAIGSLSSNKIRRRIHMTFCDDFPKYWSLLYITAVFGKLIVIFRMNQMEVKFVNLHKILSAFSSADNEKLSLHVSIHFDCDTKIVSDASDTFHWLGYVDIDCLFLQINGSRGLNKKDMCRSVSKMVKATSRVTAKKVEITGLPPGNLDLMREVLNYLNNKELIRSIDLIFGKKHYSFSKWQSHTLNIKTRFGKFNIYYHSDTMEFDLKDLHTLLSSFAAVEKESVLLDVAINYDLRNKTESDMAVILRRFQSADIGKLELKTTGELSYDLREELWSNKADMCAHILTIAEELSRVSAKQLYIERLPLRNLEFMKDVLGYLSNNESLGFVDIRFFENFLRLELADLHLSVIFGKFKVHYKINTMDFKLSDLHEFFPTSVTGNERVSPNVSFNCSVPAITEALCKLESVEIGQLLLNTRSTFRDYDSDREEIYLRIVTMVKALSRVSANMLVIQKLPVGNLEFMTDVFGCLSSCQLLKSIHMTYSDGFHYLVRAKVEIYARFGKFHFLSEMNNMPFNLLGLRQSLTQSFSLDTNCITFNVRVNHKLTQSTNTELTKIFRKFVSVHISNMSLHMSYGSNTEINDIYSRTYDMLQNLSLINAQTFVIKGLPYGNIEFIKSIHTTLEKSVPDKETHISFNLPCYHKCELKLPEHTTLTAKNQKHTREFGICKSKLDIVSLYQELQEELSIHEQRFLMDAQIRCTSNLEEDIQYVLDGSKCITFNNIEYVEGSSNLSPAIDVLEKLAEVNTKHFSYKSNKAFGYKITKSVVDAMLQCKSAQTVTISSDKPCNDIEISENIEKLVSDGIIIREVKLSCRGKKLVILGTYAEEANTLSKTIEVKFTLNHKLDHSNFDDDDDDDDDDEVNRAILDDRNALTNVYKKIFDGLKKHCIQLCIELPVILATGLQTFYSRELRIEHILDFVLEVRHMTKVTIVGGKITSSDNSSEKWTDLCSKESLQMLTFEGCDLNSSCQSLIDSFSKADERRCSQLKIILCDSLCLQNMNLLKDVLLSKSFDLNDACGSVSLGDTVFCLEGKSVSILAFSCAKQAMT